MSNGEKQKEHLKVNDYEQFEQVEVKQSIGGWRQEVYETFQGPLMIISDDVIGKGENFK